MLDLASHPRMCWFHQAVVNAVLATNPVKSQLKGTLVAWTFGTLNSVVSQNDVNCIGNSSEKMTQEFGSYGSVRVLMYLNTGKHRSTVNGRKQVKLAFFGLHLSDLDVKIANGIGFEAGFLQGFLSNLGQPTNAISLKAAMQR